MLRVDDGRWHSLPEDGSPGTPYDLGGHPFTAQGVFEGQVVHRDRAELADTLVGTDEEDAVEVALAATRFADLRRVDVPRAVLCSADRGPVAAAVHPVPRGGAPHDRSPPTPAACSCSPRSSPTRDVAWAEITRATSGSHVELWRGLVRRAPRDLLPGACSLLAFAAWQHGDGALAWCAIDRCLEVDPDYSMAHCVAQVLTGAVPPGSLGADPRGRAPGLRRRHRPPGQDSTRAS